MRKPAGSSSIEVVIGSGEGWQRALSWMTWEGYMHQKTDEGVSEELVVGSPLSERQLENVLLRVSSDQTEMGDRLTVRQSSELRKLSTKTHCCTQKYG